MTVADQIRMVQLAAQWEIAKGHLRAVAAISGSKPVEYEPSTGRPLESKYDELNARIEAFIKDIEQDALHEP